MLYLRSSDRTAAHHDFQRPSSFTAAYEIRCASELLQCCTKIYVSTYKMLEISILTHAWRQIAAAHCRTFRCLQEKVITHVSTRWHRCLVPHSRIATSTNLLLHVAYYCTHIALGWHVSMDISTKHRAKATCCSAACLALFAALCTAVPAYASVVEIITGTMQTASTALRAENS
jgi:hypothetical protein